MKKSVQKLILSLVFLTAMNAEIIAQSPRLQLFEYFDNTSIPINTNQGANAHFDSLANTNADKVIFIKYHTDWGQFSNTDTMNLQNPAQVHTRVNYYNVQGDPWAWQDGGVPADSTFVDQPRSMTQSFIDHRDYTSSPFTISVSHTLSPMNDTIHTHTVITKTGMANGILKAHVVVIEKLISFPYAQGISGDSSFRNVMKRMLPADTGTTLPAMNIGDSVVLDLDWKLAHVYDIQQLAVVSFVQDKDIATREVYQAGYSPPLTTGIVEINKRNEGIILYPNPASSTITIHSLIPNANPQFLTITDVLGNEVYHQALNNSIQSTINISQLSNGVYFYQLINNTETYRGKFVKE